MSDTPPLVPLNIDEVHDYPDRSMAKYLSFAQNLRDLIHITHPEIAERLVISKAELLPRDFLKDDLRQRYADVLYRIPYLISDEEQAQNPDLDSEVWIYVIEENKSRKVPLTPFQITVYAIGLLERIIKMWEEQKVPASERKFPHILPYLFYSGDENWEGPINLRDCFVQIPSLSHFLQDWNIPFLNLKQVTDERLVGEHTPIGQVLRLYKVENAPYPIYEQVLRQTLEGIDELPDVPMNIVEESIWMTMLNAVNRREAEESVKAQQLILDYTAKESERLRGEFNMKKVVLADGLVQILMQEGKRRIEEETLQNTLVLQVEKKFGKPSEAVLKKIDSVDLETLNAWLLNIVVANSLEEVGIQA